MKETNQQEEGGGGRKARIVVRVTKRELEIGFLTMLIFTNGICPYCKSRIFDLENGKLAVRPVEAKRHLRDNPDHYERCFKTSALLGTLSRRLKK